jgi:hypothetical protein
MTARHCIYALNRLPLHALRLGFFAYRLTSFIVWSATRPLHWWADRS